MPELEKKRMIYREVYPDYGTARERFDYLKGLGPLKPQFIYLISKQTMPPKHTVAWINYGH